MKKRRGVLTSDGRRRRWRRRVITPLAALCLLASAALTSCSSDDSKNGAGAGATTSTTARRGPVPRGPNVLYVVLDDLDQLTMPYWDAMPKTKRRLADTGVVFSNAFVTSPECCPSRASLLTGNYPHNTRIYDSTPPDGGYTTFAENGAEKDTVATRLHDAGYRTSFIGKYLNGYEEHYDADPVGWDEWFGVGKGFSAGYNFKANHNGTIESFGSKPTDYLTDVLRDRALEELARTERDDDRPFLMALWTTAPHDAIPAAPRHADNPFARADLPRRENFDEPDVTDKPTWLREGQRSLTPADIGDLTTRYRKMMGSLYAVDDLIDDVLSKIETDGELDHTVVVFTSDNGYNFGAHRLPHKMAPYEESTRVPLVVAGPGFSPHTDNRLVTNNDLVPTILSAAGLPAGDVDGAPLQPLADGGPVPWRSDFLIQYHGTYHPLNMVDTFDDVRRGIPGRRRLAPDERPLAFVPTFRAVHSEQWLYVEWYAGSQHEYELYDVNRDPGELQNLLATGGGASRYASTTTELQRRLEALGACAGPSCRP